MTIGPGSLINGKYRLGRLLGEGGMGAIFEARHELLATEVALKFLHPALSSRPTVVARFIQEARVSASIKSPHVVAVVDVDQTPEGLAFLVMELLHGESLAARMSREPTLPMPLAIGIAVQVLLALEAAHAHSVVHRDMKPENVFLTDAPDSPNAASDGLLVKILDFGIAKLRTLGEVRAQLTRPGVVIGTPEYMAPEQVFAAETVDGRADLYGVGAMLFEMLAGRRPVHGDDPRTIANAAMSGATPRLDVIAPRVPASLADVVAIALAPKPDDRFRTAMAMRKALINAARDGGVTLDLSSTAHASPRGAPGSPSSLPSIPTPTPPPVAAPAVIVAPVVAEAVAPVPAPAPKPVRIEAVVANETIAATPSPFAGMYGASPIPPAPNGASPVVVSPMGGSTVATSPRAAEAPAEGGTAAGFRPPFQLAGAWPAVQIASIPDMPAESEDGASLDPRLRRLAILGVLIVAASIVVAVLVALRSSDTTTAVTAPSVEEEAPSKPTRTARSVAPLVIDEPTPPADSAKSATSASIRAATPHPTTRPLPSASPSTMPSTLPSGFPSPFPHPSTTPSGTGRTPDIIEIPLPWPVPG